MISTEEAQKAKGTLDRFHSRLERLEKKAEITDAAIEAIKKTIKEKEDVIEEYKKAHGIIEYPPRCAECDKICETGGILRVRLEDGSEEIYCKRCYDKLFKEGKKMSIVGAV